MLNYIIIKKLELIYIIKLGSNYCEKLKFKENFYFKIISSKLRTLYFSKISI